MRDFNAYWFITGASVIVVISYFFNLIAKKTNFPSVLLLLILGIVIKAGLVLGGIPLPGLDPVLEVLGIVGLIMIVLEASLDLKFSREKASLIARSFLLAFCSLVGVSMVIAILINSFIEIGLLTSFIYAIPLSMVSSAIIIPSVVNFREEQREFMVYESTFSDILGILLFYFTIESTHFESAGLLISSILLNILVTVVSSVVLSVMLIFMFQRIRTQVKLFLLLAVLIVLYSTGKLLHLSSLMIILIFGLMLENKDVIFARFYGNQISEGAMDHIHVNFKLITLETAFIIRTFFFVIFGMTITLKSLIDLRVILISIAMTGVFLAVRYILLKLIMRRGFNEIMFLIPRGLITILLFYSIPPEFQSQAFDPGILFFTILFTSAIMTVSLVHQKWQKRIVDIRKEHVCEVYGRFIPEVWIPGAVKKNGINDNNP